MTNKFLIGPVCLSRANSWHRTFEIQQSLTILGTTIDSQLRFTDHMKTSKAKLSRRNNMLKSLGGKEWGLAAVDSRRLYKSSYVRPGRANTWEVWERFLSVSVWSHIETANTLAAWIISGVRRGTPVEVSLTEAGLTTLKQETEEEAAKLLEHCSLKKRYTHSKIGGSEKQKTTEIARRKDKIGAVLNWNTSS